MTKWALLVIIIIVATIALIALVLSIANNSRMSVSGSSLQDSEATVETTLPNVTCRKVVRLAWSPVRLECEEKKELQD